MTSPEELFKHPHGLHKERMQVRRDCLIWAREIAEASALVPKVVPKAAALSEQVVAPPSYHDYNPQPQRSSAENLEPEPGVLAADYTDGREHIFYMRELQDLQSLQADIDAIYRDIDAAASPENNINDQMKDAA